MLLLNILVGDWVSLLNPALWLLDLHPAIIFGLALKYKCRRPIIFTIILTVLLSGLLFIVYMTCQDMLLEFLIQNKPQSYSVYDSYTGIQFIVGTLFGWTYALFLIPFWFIVLFLPWLVVKHVRRINVVQTKTLTTQFIGPAAAVR